MIRAVIYAKYSSDRQTEQSIEVQVHVCSDFALRNNYVIVDTYIDRAMGGTNDNRDAFQRMIDSLSKDKKALKPTISVQEALQEKPITYEIVKSYLCQFFKLDNATKNRRLLVDLFIKKIIIYNNDDIVIICKSHNKSLKTKNEHSNNEMFIFNRNGAGQCFKFEHIHISPSNN